MCENPFKEFLLLESSFLLKCCGLWALLTRIFQVRPRGGLIDSGPDVKFDGILTLSPSHKFDEKNFTKEGKVFSIVNGKWNIITRKRN